MSSIRSPGLTGLPNVTQAQTGTASTAFDLERVVNKVFSLRCNNVVVIVSTAVCNTFFIVFVVLFYIYFFKWCHIVRQRLFHYEIKH
jgi:hypothetical protein